MKFLVCKREHQMKKLRKPTGTKEVQWTFAAKLVIVIL
jgi:hypothetical protein